MGHKVPTKPSSITVAQSEQASKISRDQDLI